jgi:uncharacterized protein YdhG (YjbR/CyaY superfamily)
MKAKPETIDEYLAAVDIEKRVALERLREIIQAAAPQATESITYGVPVFRLNGMLVGFGAAKDHCAFYPCSGTVTSTLRKELKSYETGKGTIQFQPNKPLPLSLVRKIVKTRMVENAAKCEARLRKARKPTRR